MIITLSGAIGSGKSTLATTLATTRGAPRAGFGDYVRHLAGGLGLDTSDRTVLQDLGHQRVETDARAFLDDALAWAGHQPGADLILDGLRHIKVLEALRARAEDLNDPVTLIYLDTPLRERHARVASRGVTLENMTADERHPAELDLYVRLKGAADLVLAGTETPAAVAAQALSFIARPKASMRASQT